MFDLIINILKSDLTSLLHEDLRKMKIYYDEIMGSPLEERFLIELRKIQSIPFPIPVFKELYDSSINQRLNIIKTAFPIIFSVVMEYDYYFRNKLDFELSITTELHSNNVIPLNKRQILIRSTENIQIWNLETKTPDITLHSASDVKLLSDGRIATLLEKGGICIWNISSYSESILERTISFKDDSSIHSIAILPNDNIMAELEINDCSFIEVWNPNTRDNILSIKVGYKTILDLIPINNNRVISFSDDGLLEVWNLNTTKLEKSIEVRSSIVKVFPDGKYFVSASFCDKLLKIWNLETGICERILKGHIELIDHVILLSNNKIASSSINGEIRIWNLEGKCERLLKNNGKIEKMAYTIDGLIISYCENNFLRFWDTEMTSEISLGPTYVNDIIIHPNGLIITDHHHKICVWK